MIAASGIPCFMVGANTERPITIRLGASTLIEPDMARLQNKASRIRRSEAKEGQIPPLCDARASERIAAVTAGRLGG